MIRRIVRPSAPQARAYRPRNPVAGHALIMTLCLTAILTPLAVFAVQQAHTALVLQRQACTTLELFYVAEAGLAHALADLDADPSFDRLQLGPDGVAGTDDDGEFPFLHAPPAFFPRGPFRYEVSVEARGRDVLDIVARGFGAGPATQAVAATVIRSPSRPSVAFVAGWRELF